MVTLAKKTSQYSQTNTFLTTEETNRENLPVESSLFARDWNIQKKRSNHHGMFLNLKLRPFTKEQ